MGKKLDAILGRNFKSYKLKALANLAVSRLAVFKNQRQARRNQARSDVVQLLQQGHLDTALLRVDYVIKEQNLLDVYVMMEGYFNLLVERIHLIEQERVCPDELKEAISSLLFASSRCGDFPELQEIRTVLTTRYGRELAARSIELRNNCGVNPKMIQKLSTRQAELANRTKALKEIASENGLAMQLEEGSEKRIKPEQDMEASSSGTNKPDGSLKLSPEEMKKFELSDSMKVRRQYRDVADAAQAAFESAAYAAEAARAAVELSRSDSSDPGNNQYSPHNRAKQASLSSAPLKLQSPLGNQETVHEHDGEELKGKSETEQSRSLSTSSSDSEGTNLEVITVSVSSEEEDDFTKKMEKDIVVYDSDDESPKSDLPINSSEKLKEKTPSVVQSGLKHRYSTAYDAEASRIQSSPSLNINQGPLSDAESVKDVQDVMNLNSVPVRNSFDFNMFRKQASLAFDVDAFDEEIDSRTYESAQLGIKPRTEAVLNLNSNSNPVKNSADFSLFRKQASLARIP